MTPRVRRWRSVAVAFLALAVALAAAVAPVTARPGTRALPSQPDDAYADVLFGGLAALARDPFAVRQLAGVASRRGTAAQEIAVAIDVADEETLERVRALGARIVNRSGLRVEAYLAVSAVRQLAWISGVRSASPIRARWIDTLVSAGVTAQGASAWQTAGFSGNGVKVGIIDSGFQGISALLGTELPNTVNARCFTAVGTFSTTVSDCENGIHHGAGVAEIVLDMAPEVSLYVANPISAMDGAAVINWMTAQGVRIINASFASGLMFEGPGDGTTTLTGTTYDDVDLATSKGALWVNSAGNHGETGWTGAWLDADSNGFLEFSAGNESNTLHMVAGQRIVVAIRWAEPWGKAKANYNVGVYAAGGELPLAIGDSIGAGIPDRVLEFTAPSSGDYDIAIARLSGAGTSRMQLLVGSEYPLGLSHRVKAGTLPSPADSKNPLMLTVAAADVTTPTVIEGFSSQGPTVDNRVKPDITATDCADTVTIPGFCGTSEAAPYVSGAAALVLQAHPTFTTAQIIDFLTSRALPIGSPIPNSISGYGLLSLGAVPPPPAGAPVALAFETQPAGSPATTPFATQPVVRIVDGAGTTVSSGPGSPSDVTLALGANPGSATLTCQGGLTKAAVAGTATFAGCTVSMPGSGYTIVATAIGLAPATSTPFDMAPPPPPIPLVFTSAPTDGTTNTSFAPQPVVTLTDPLTGGPVTTGLAATAPVTLAIGTNPFGATLFCRGGLTVPAVAGVATFSGCRISPEGTGYALAASSPGLVPAVSAPFTLAAGPAAGTMSLAATASAIVWGDAVVLTARLGAPAGAGTPAGRTIHLQSSLDGVRWNTIAQRVTDPSGGASLTYRPVTNLFYRAVFDGTADLGGVAGGTSRVTVRETVSIRPDNGGKVKSIAGNARVTFTVTVRPSRPDVPAGTVTFQLYRLVNRAWRLLQTATGRPNAVGQVQFVGEFGNLRASYYVRASANPTAVNANSLPTPVVRFDVR